MPVGSGILGSSSIGQVEIERGEVSRIGRVQTRRAGCGEGDLDPGDIAAPCDLARIREPWFGGKSIVGHNDFSAESFGRDDAQRRFRKDGIMHDGEVPDDGTLMVPAMDAIALGVENDVVADDGIGGGLDAVVAGVPDDIPLDDIGCFPVGIIDDDAGIICVVDDIVADDVSVASVFDLDAISLADRPALEIVDVIVLDHGVENVAVG